MFELLNQQIKAGEREFTGEFFQKLTASDGAAGDLFGGLVSVSSDGAVIVIGAQRDDDRGTDSGSVYIFTRQANGSYLQTQKLTASDGIGGDWFGGSVAMSANASVIAVGARGDDDRGADCGAVYVFTRQADGSYTQTQKLTASDGAAYDSFGYSVSMSSHGEVMVVGVFADDDKGSNSGSVYVFTKQANGSYLRVQKLTASDGAANDCFGYSVSVSGDASVVAVGVYGDDDKGNASGSAYVFTKQANGSYLQTQKLTASDGDVGDNFGRSVSVSSDGAVVVVGSHLDDDKGADSGSAYIFIKQTDGSYLQTQKLTAPDGILGDLFGTSVSIAPDASVIAVSAYYDDDKGDNSGSVYVFTKQLSGSYTQTQKLVPPGDAPSANMGISSSISDEGTVVIGARTDTVNGNAAGSVYIFK